ncbi:phosphatase PAP2 family protein [Sphingomonas sp. UYP23]
MRKYLGSALTTLALGMIGSAGVAAPHAFHYLAAPDFAPGAVLPAPPARGSVQEQSELAQLRTLIAAAPAERLARARSDDGQETPALFDRTLGVTLATYPLTWALLRDVQEEAAAAASLGKAYFHRTRPYGVDPTLPNCAKTPTGKAATSYPSGHAILGYSTGFVLARLLKGRSSEIFDRAADYAMSRELCGVHFASDLDASHALGTLVASALLANPAFRAKFEAAHAELLAAHVAGA